MYNFNMKNNGVIFNNDVKDSGIGYRTDNNNKKHYYKSITIKLENDDEYLDKETINNILYSKEIIINNVKYEETNDIKINKIIDIVNRNGIGKFIDADKYIKNYKNNDNFETNAIYITIETYVTDDDNINSIKLELEK